MTPSPQGPNQTPQTEGINDHHLSASADLARISLAHRIPTTGEHEVLQFPKHESYVGIASHEIANPDAVDMLTELGEHDRVTFDHVIRVAAFTAKLLDVTGETLELTRPEKTSIMRAALLHDMGKLDIDRELLNSPGGLSPEERAEIKEHTSRGRERLMSFESYKEDGILRGLTLLHHQIQPDPYVDPEGTDFFVLDTGCEPGKFKEILALFAMADQLEALTSDRPYVRAKNFKREDILGILRDNLVLHGYSTDIVDFIDGQPFFWDERMQRHDIGKLTNAFSEAGGVVPEEDNRDDVDQRAASQS